MKPSSYFCCDMCAWETLCKGCPEERGWTGEIGVDPEPVGEMCDGIRDIYDDEDCVVEMNGEPVCARRSKMRPG